jgi:hypothetical protein
LDVFFIEFLAGILIIYNLSIYQFFSSFIFFHRETPQSPPQTPEPPSSQAKSLPSELSAIVSNIAAAILPVAPVTQSEFDTPHDKLNRGNFAKFLRSPSELLPSILRSEDDKVDSEIVAVGWKYEATNRKEREESLRFVF